MWLLILALATLYCTSCGENGAVDPYTYATIEPLRQLCLSKFAEPGLKLTLRCEVLEGGYYDIDVIIEDPDDQEIHREERQSAVSHTFPAQKEGMYKFCFSNRMSTMVSKLIGFSIDVSAHDAASKNASA